MRYTSKVKRRRSDLEHFGVRGMKWGVRKAQKSGNGESSGWKSKAKTAAKLGAGIAAGAALAYGGYKLANRGPHGVTVKKATRWGASMEAFGKAAKRRLQGKAQGQRAQQNFKQLNGRKMKKVTPWGEAGRAARRHAQNAGKAARKGARFLAKGK